MDLQSAFDRGTRPLLTAADFPTLPLNIDDSTLQSSSTHEAPPSDPDYFSDMAPSLVMYRAMVCQHKFTEAGASQAASHDTTYDRTIWEEKTNAIAEYEHYTQRLAAGLSASSPPMQRFAVSCAQNILKTMHLLLHRPIYKTVLARPPADDKFDVMEAATDLLERAPDQEQNGAELYIYAWNKWTPWFALAIILAELCSRPRNPATDRSWKVAQVCYTHFAQQVADGDSGLLWKPIARLMRKVKDLRGPTAAETMASLQAMSVNQNPYQDEPFALAAEQDQSAIHFDLSSVQQPVQATYDLSHGLGNVSDAAFDPALFWDQDFSQTATSGLWDTTEGMSWFNWEHFIDDVNSHGNV